MTRPLELVSFGFLFGPAPEADRIEDVRRRLRDPAAAKDVLDLDGLDIRVQRIVGLTPGAEFLLLNLYAYAQSENARPTRIAIGCAGGRHRAPSLIEMLAERLNDAGRPVEVEHRDIHRPRVLR